MDLAGEFLAAREAEHNLILGIGSLQILLAEQLPGVGRARLMADMDAWGYSFRLGSTHAWFTHDAAEARAFLAARGLA